MEDLCKPTKFCKPTHSNPTRHLFIGNCGPAVGLKENDIRSIFEKFGVVENVCISPEAHKSYIYLTYDTVASASAALSALNGAPAIRDSARRVFVIRYADTKTIKVRLDAAASYQHALWW